MSHSNIAYNTSHIIWIGTAEWPDSFMNHIDTDAHVQGRSVGVVDIPAVEDTASRPCPFDPFPACSLDICVEEVTCMSG